MPPIILPIVFLVLIFVGLAILALLVFHACIGQKFDMFWVPVIGLGTGMQHNGRQIHFQKSHILYNKGIYANPIQLMYEFTTFFEFLVVQNGVDDNKNLRLEKVGIPDQFFNIFQRVGRIRTGTESLGSYIQGIRS